MKVWQVPSLGPPACPDQCDTRSFLDLAVAPTAYVAIRVATCGGMNTVHCRRSRPQEMARGNSDSLVRNDTVVDEI